MPQDGEKTKRLVTFRKKLETRIEELDSELKDLQAILETVNSILLEKGFKHAEITKEPAVTEPLPAKEKETESVTPLKADTGELLANLFLTADSLRVVPVEDKRFDVNTPPFMPFLVERVLSKMQERDSELAKAGQLVTEKVFSYNIVQDGDLIREIVVRNFDADRLRELKSSIRWTLEKMYEKTRDQG